MVSAKCMKLGSAVGTVQQCAWQQPVALCCTLESVKRTDITANIPTITCKRTIKRDHYQGRSQGQALQQHLSSDRQGSLILSHAFTRTCICCSLFFVDINKTCEAGTSAQEAESLRWEQSQCALWVHLVVTGGL